MVSFEAICDTYDLIFFAILYYAFYIQNLQILNNFYFDGIKCIFCI